MPPRWPSSWGSATSCRWSGRRSARSRRSAWRSRPRGSTAGIVMIVVNVVYQQFENHILQPIVYRKTVQLSAFLVLVAVLIGGELMGVLGALVAIPIAGSIQLVVRELRQGAGNRPGTDVHRARVSLKQPGPADGQPGFVGHGCGLAHELPDRVHVLGRRRHVPDRHADGVAAAQVGVRDERAAVGVHPLDDVGVQAAQLVLVVDARRMAAEADRRERDRREQLPAGLGLDRRPPGAGRARCGPAMSAARPSTP